MFFIYNIGIQFLHFILRCTALFNKKIALGVKGRSKTFSLLESHLNKDDKTLWFHCASLGEYEQGLPVFSELRKLYSTHKIVLTFFSPSGYEIKKESSIADIVIYLPLDTTSNAKIFLDIVNPELTVFVKYDIWPNLLNELKKRSKRAILISALFRKEQSYFKFYGKMMREALFAFEHIFVQDENSKHLLNTINYKAITVSGDTRFDRVMNQLEQNNTLDFIEDFKQDELCVVGGSTWPEDEHILIEVINSENFKQVKFIIAPHNIKASQIKQLQKSITLKSVLYSKRKNKTLSDYNVLIIDTIGLLSKIYSYADIAYVGGAIGKTGLHNTLEPAVFGIPIIIGTHYNNFPEAKAMIKNNGMFSIKNEKELNTTLNNLILNQENRHNSGRNNLQYVKKNQGAVVQIINFIRK